MLHLQGRHAAGPFTLGRASKAVTLIASVWIGFELINVWWPRSPSLPWYQNWGTLVVSVGLAVAGVVAYAFAPRHDGQLGDAPPAPAPEAAAIGPTN